MDSYMEPQFHPHQHHHQDQPNSGLLRFRSAPSSILSDFTQNLSSSENFVVRFGDEFSESSYERKPQRLNSNSINGYSGSVLGRSPPQYPKPTMVSTTSRSGSSSIHSSRGVGGLNLNRQSSSPAGFFNHLDPQNGYTMTRGVGNFGVGNGTNDESSAHTSRLSMNHLPQIPEFGSENVKETNPEFSFASWSDSGSEVSHLSETGGLATRPNVLSHHLSLPMTSSSEMDAIEKGLHFQDTIPSFKVRAKRGCATHPRSIAERVRRNRISERMRKLQDLVPNMDKQTNTADMLDFAVEYIKDLQNQHKRRFYGNSQCRRKRWAIVSVLTTSLNHVWLHQISINPADLRITGLTLSTSFQMLQ